MPACERQGMRWGTLLTAREDTIDHNLRTTSVCKQTIGAAEESKGEARSRLWKAFHGSAASPIQDPQLQIKPKSHQTTQAAEVELKSNLKITEAFRVLAASIVKLCRFLQI